MNKIDIFDVFLKKYSVGIKNLLKQYSLDLNDYSDEKIKDLLILNFSNLLSLNVSDSDIFDSLFYHLNDYLKNNKKPVDKKNKIYICPGCLFLGKTTFLLGTRLLSCKVCSFEASKPCDAKYLDLYKKFSTHSSKGYRCGDCDNFIPASLAYEQVVICPYLNCTFVGDINSLKVMRHPSSSETKENVDIKSSAKNIIHDSTINTIQQIIEYQSNNLAFTKYNFTLVHKLSVYKAFASLLNQKPDDMKNYLLGSRTGGFQHKVFQEYIRILEQSLPFTIKKNNKVEVVDSLLNKHLCIFDGISNFNSIIKNFCVKNNTTEFYIGGRKGSYTKPFYIGKVLNVIDLNSNKSITDKVVEYSFSKIIFKDIEDNTPVRISHLRIPPHYQMGGMVYVNRVRKSIVDQIKNIEDVV